MKERRYEKTCEYCGEPFLAWHKTGRYCSNVCSIRANPKPQNLAKYPITLDLLREADERARYGTSRLEYVANRVGCTPSAVSYAARRLGFQWTHRPRQKQFTRTTKVERRYVYSIGCVVCGEKRVVDAAHLVPRVEGGSGMEENIIPLCPTHHRCYDRGILTDDETNIIVGFLYEKYPDLSERYQHVRKSTGLQG